MNVKAVHYERKSKKQLVSTRDFGLENAKKVRAFHKSFPEYAPTPLVSLENLARQLNVKGIYVKDESYRFNLNAFKVLGGSYSIGKHIAKCLGEDIENLSYSKITSREVKEKLGDITFVTATDGNHGRGVAWTANRLKQKSIVYMPKGSSEERLNHILKLGAEASITDFNYDDAVRIADKKATSCGGLLVQDTAWDGYEEIPHWIMEGYTTMAYEIVEQLRDVKPTHVFLQAGVGAMAGAVTAFISDYYGEERPVITIVEPDNAACIYKTAEKKDGSIHPVKGDMNTIMAGLACGEPCSIGWQILRDYAEFFVSMPDAIAAEGMRILGNPLAGDERIISGESGAAGFGLMSEALRNPELSWLKQQLKLDESSVVLCISTEGDTDKENYRKIVWDGAYPKE